MSNDSSAFQQKLGLLDATMLVIGSMIGSGIFIVSADITRNVGSAGMLLLIWVFTGIMMIAAALSYGELSAMFPKAGGLYVYLREAFGPMVAFLYGWALFVVIQTGTIAAIGVAFSKFAAYLFPILSERNYLLGGEGDALKISAAQVTSILIIVFLTFINSRGVQNGRLVQLIFTIAKIGGVLLLVFMGFFSFKNSTVWHENWQDAWRIGRLIKTPDGLQFQSVTGVWNIISTMAIASVGAIFASFAWDNITFIAGEIKRPQRNIGLSLILGVGATILLYFIVNIMYLSVLSVAQIAFAESDRVAVEAAKVIFGNTGTMLIAAIVMISTFGCMNGFILSSARVFYVMAHDKLFFKSAAKLNSFGVPSFALWVQCVWACILCLSGRYGDLLDYVIFVILIFYGLAILAVMVLRRTRPDIERPYRVPAYPFIPILYLVITLLIAIPLLVYKPTFTWPGLGLVLLGIPIYYWMKKRD